MQSQVSACESIVINKYGNQIETKSNLRIKILDQELEKQFYFDYFFRRVALTTQDGRIKIYSIINKGEKGFEKSFEIEFQAHNGSINSISWQCPKFGNLLLTCGKDEGIYIWEEQGKFWRSQQLKETRQRPVLAKWIEDSSSLAIAYQDGYFQIRYGDSYETQLEQQLYKQEFVSFDLKDIEDKRILVSCGIDENYYTFDVFAICDETFEKMFSEQIQNDLLRNIIIAPYITINELKIGYQSQQCVGIITLDFEEFEDGPQIQFTPQNNQLLELAECRAFTWSMLGNEILVYGAESIKLFQQNIRNEYLPI